jgi:hypothetical protein
VILRVRNVIERRLRPDALIGWGGIAGDLTGDPQQAMRMAMRTSGRVVLAAAGVMVAVFLTFARDPSPGSANAAWSTSTRTQGRDGQQPDGRALRARRGRPPRP